MIDGLGPEASKLMRDAHCDAPTYSQRTRMWEAIEAGAIAGASIAPGAKGLGGIAKLLIGLAVGGTLAGGVAVLGRSQLSPDVAADLAIGRSAMEAPRFARSAQPSDLELNPAPAQVDRSGEKALPASKARAAALPSQSEEAGQEDALVREARLISEARGALLRGEADRALRVVRLARSGPHPGLEPEELALESRALRQLGQLGEADAVDRDLAKRFPDHALAR